ncbi:MAG: M23 family metallopeptidase [Patescibacteria group bacterium]|nr:M23 family metallopeptidase [Patescibacteria group bacterium]MCL5432013.1 M23 family metallopeptidase [Patescibacteria group bacterium]
MRRLSLGLFFVVLWAMIFAPSAQAQTITVKPELTWQRSTESNDKTVHESHPAENLPAALVLPMDPDQVVWDQGMFTPLANSLAVPAGNYWASWPQYSWDGNPNRCGPIYYLRHFQAKFNLDTSMLGKSGAVILSSPYYPDNVIPINDNIYIYLNDNFLTQLGTSYKATYLNVNDQHGSAPYANETDGWVANGQMPEMAYSALKSGENTMDLITGEWCQWGGMGKLALTVQSEVPDVAAFLDLPWDYESAGLSFTDAALAINAFFDHEYPFLSLGLEEPASAAGTIINFQSSRRINGSYSSHDGYDYGHLARANLGDPILAAASGCASYSYSPETGNAITIAHPNGYQTKNFHLEDADLVSSDSAKPCVDVTQHQMVGRLGYTGHVIPADEPGAHVHFMVYNKDGVVVDPFGWQSPDPDPWETYPTGAKSYYLWQKEIDNLDKSLPANSSLSFKNGHFTLTFFDQTSTQDLKINLQSAPEVRSANLVSIGPSLWATATDSLGGLVGTFQNSYMMEVDFNGLDLTGLNLDTVAIYSSQDGKTWTKETTTVDKINKVATTQLNHFTYFALMAAKSDTTAPQTSSSVWGYKVTLAAADNSGGTGTSYILYKVDDSDWQEYTEPVEITDEGQHTIEYFAVDNADNQEEVKSETIEIKTDNQTQSDNQTVSDNQKTTENNNQNLVTQLISAVAPAIEVPFTPVEPGIVLAASSPSPILAPAAAGTGVGFPWWIIIIILSFILFCLAMVYLISDR